MTRPDDFEVRQQALSVNHSCIVQAPAGSGKTELLIRRYLTLLARVEQPEQVLAITFTRKAAAEMLTRVVQLLEGAALGESPAGDEFLAEGWRLARAVVEQDRRQQWGIIQQPARLRIVTIDSFSQGLNQALPLLAGSGVQLIPTDNPELLYREAARELLAGIDQGSACKAELMTLLGHLDNQRRRLEGLLVEMLSKRDQWLKALPHPKQYDQFIAGMERSLARLCAQWLERWRTAMPSAWFLQLADLIDYAAGNFENQQPALTGPAHHRDDELNELDYWRAVVGLLLTQEGNPRKTVNKSQGFPPGKGDPADKKAAFIQLIAELNETPNALAVLTELTRLPAPSMSAEDRELIRTLVVVLHYAAAELQLVFQARGEGDFAELSLRALQALSAEERAGDGPSELALALDYKLQHILVDEFQDTSWLQYRLIELLTAGWQPGDGRTLFLVGDPMQSIYRFREADVGLFLRAWQEPIGDLELQPLTLSANFRSDAPLVEDNNRLFQQLFPTTNDIARGAVRFSPSTPTRTGAGQTGLFCHGFSGEAARTDEALALAMQIEAAPGQGQGDAILVKSRAHLLTILPLLRARDISFQAVELQSLAQSGAVLDLLAITRALLHPADRVAWIALLLGPCVGITLTDLTRLLTFRSADTPIISLLLAGDESTENISAEGRARLANLVNHYSEVTSRSGLRLRQQVESLWLALGGPALLVDSVGLSDAEDYLTLLDDEPGDGRGISIAHLERLLSQRYRSSGEADAGQLQIMTIHKSKGLQFDRVHLPALDKTGRIDHPPLLAWEEHATAEQSAELLLAPIRSPYDDHHPVYHYIQLREKERDRQEQLRLLYVASTRARYQVHLYAALKRNREGELKQPAANTLLGLLWPGIGQRFVESVEQNEGASHTSGETSDPVQIRRRLNSEWRLPELPASLLVAGRDETITESATPIEYDWAGESARITGVLVHRHLCRLANLPADRWGTYLQRSRPHYAAQLAQAGIAADEVANAANRVGETLEQTVGDPRGRWILIGGSQARSEYALTWGQNGQVRNVIIDRTFVDDQGTRWIIDYKTGYHGGGDLEGFLDREQERYSGQLQEYAQVIRQLGDEPIRLGLYFPRMAAWREWVAEYEN